MSNSEPFQIRKGDRHPSLSATLQEVVDGSAIDLSAGGTTVSFSLRTAAGVVIFTSAAVIVDAAHGKVRYDWGVGETPTAGSFLGVFIINFPDATTQTVPTAGGIYITVVP